MWFVATKSCVATSRAEQTVARAISVHREVGGVQRVLAVVVALLHLADGGATERPRRHLVCYVGVCKQVKIIFF